MKSDNEIMDMAIKELQKHNIGDDRFSHRYIFMIGYKAGWIDRKSTEYKQIFQGNSPLGDEL